MWQKVFIILYLALLQICSISLLSCTNLKQTGLAVGCYEYISGSRSSVFLCSVAAYLAKPSAQPFLIAWQSLRSCA